MRIGIILLALGMFVCMPECSAAKKHEKHGMKCESGCRIAEHCPMHDCCCPTDGVKCEKCMCPCVPCGHDGERDFCRGVKHAETCTKASHVSCAKAACAKTHHRF